MRSCNFCHTNTKNPENNLGIFCLIIGRPKLNGYEPTNGKVYVFVGKTRKVMKLLHWERGGYVMYYKRLETGRLFPGCSRHASKSDSDKFDGTSWFFS